MKGKFGEFLPPERIKKESPLWSNRILTEYVVEHARKIPDHVAVAEVHPDLDIVPKTKRKAYVLSYAQLWREVLLLAEKLRKKGIQPGDVVSVQLPNWAEFIIIDLALTRIGAVINPIAPIYRRKEISFFLRRSCSKAILIPTFFRGFNYVRMIEEIQSNCPDLQFIWTLGDRSLPTSLDPPYGSAIDVPVPSNEDLGPMPRPDEVKVILFTAGTTGEPKGVLHSHNTADFVAKTLIDALSFTSDEVFLIALTLGHGAGYFHGYTTSMRSGATLVLLDKWGPSAINDTLNAWHCTSMSGTTPFLADVVEYGIKKAISQFKTFMVGGAYVPTELMRRAKKRMPYCTFTRGWGQTENSLVTLHKYGAPVEKVFTTDGRPGLHKEIQVRDSVAGIPVPVGTEGIVWSRGPSLFLGYLRRPDLTREAMDEKGWFCSGDRGRIDSEGYLTITGRLKDLIIRGGENFPVKEMEDLLSAHQAIGEVAIVAAPDKRLQEKACAYVSLRPGNHFDFDEMIRFFESQGIAKRNYPEYLEVLPELPKSHAGKIMKYELRAMIAQKIGLPPVDAGERANDF